MNEARHSPNTVSPKQKVKPRQSQHPPGTQHQTLVSQALKPRPASLKGPFQTHSLVCLLPFAACGPAMDEIRALQQQLMEARVKVQHG